MPLSRAEPKVSVVIPAFNAAQTLADTLTAVAAQTLKEFEVVIVDDGSTDATHAIAAQYAERDARFRVLRQTNGGIAHARNAGLRNAVAPYVAPLDSDDIWHSTFLEKLWSALAGGGPDAVLAYANSRIIDTAGQVLHDAPRLAESGWVFNRLLVRNFIGNGSAAMFRRDLALEVGGYAPHLQHDHGAQGSEDWLIALHLAARGRVVAVNEYLVGYRSMPQSMSSNTLRMRRSRVHALRTLFAALQCRTLTAARWAIGEAHGKCFLHQVRDRLPLAALKSLGAALWFDPRGTIALLFGSERLKWLREEFGAPLNGQRRSFTEYDPREGQAPPYIPRLEAAKRWDAHCHGPLVRRLDAGKSLGINLKSIAKSAARSILPETVYGYLRSLYKKTPAVGRVRFGDLRRLEPVSRSYGFDRGRPIDRYYIENFLVAQSSHIRGTVLEIGDNAYTKKFGRAVERSTVLHVSSESDDVTYVDDLTDGSTLPSNGFDCVILTQTLHLIYDMKAALATVYRILKPGGVLLATVPGITQISDAEWNETWYWSLSEHSARRLVGEIFPPGAVQVATFGNVLSATSFLQGLADTELTQAELDHVDPEYPVTVTIKACTGQGEKVSRWLDERLR